VSAPAGEPYDWYQRGMVLLEQGNSDAAALLFERVLDVEPGSTAAQEAYARAMFDGRHFEDAMLAFNSLVERSPDSDYAHYGLGLTLWRLQRFTEAEQQLAMAFVMRPENAEYGKALAQVRATLRERLKAGLPKDGPVQP